MIKPVMFLMLIALCMTNTSFASGNDKQQQLLGVVKNYYMQDSALNKAREEKFKKSLNQQQNLLRESEARLAAAKDHQEKLKKKFNLNDDHLVGLQGELERVSGKLGEVFGIAKQTAAELRPLLKDSIISSQYRNRDTELKFSEAKRIPNFNDFRALWYQLQLEMVASGEITQFNTSIINSQGEQKETLVTRFGSFSAMTAAGEYLRWGELDKQLTVFPIQPQSNSAEALNNYQNRIATDVLIDPSRGELLTMLERMPTIKDRINQAGEIGYFILALGVVGILILFIQVLRSIHLEYLVNQQLKNPDLLRTDNPLGRILTAIDPKEQNLEQLELKIDECTVKEIPRLEQGHSFLKLLATVAPLLGLLGTVTGMIETFQSITLYGTSDPKLMANGISQALMTTVLGLLVAIPLMFGHSYLSSRSRRLGQILQEKTLAALYNAAQKPLVFSHAA